KEDGAWETLESANAPSACEAFPHPPRRPPEEPMEFHGAAFAPRHAQYLARRGPSRARSSLASVSWITSPDAVANSGRRRRVRRGRVLPAFGSSRRLNDHHPEFSGTPVETDG